MQKNSLGLKLPKAMIFKASSTQNLPTSDDESATDHFSTPLKNSFSLSYSRSDRKMHTMASLQPLKIPSIVVKKEAVVTEEDETPKKVLENNHRIDPKKNISLVNLRTLEANDAKSTAELKNIIKIMKKEIERLENLNKYLIMAQERRDHLLSLSAEENRILKEKLNKLSNAFMKKDFKGDPKIKADSGEKKKKDEIRKASEVKSKIKKLDMTEIKAEKNIIDSTDLHLNKKTGSKLVEDKTNHQAILNTNMTEAEALSRYNEFDLIKCLKPIMAEEDIFITHVTGSDYTQVLELYDNLYNLFGDHKVLYVLAYRLKKIIKAANSMTASLILTEAMEKIVDETCELLECDRASVFIVDAHKEELWSKVAKGSKTIKIPMNKGIVGFVAATGKIVNILNAYADDRFNKEVDLRTNYKTNTILCTPVFDKNQTVIGVVQAINKFNGHFTKDDEGLLTILANLAGIVIRNSLSYDQQLLFHNSLRHALKTGVYLNTFNNLNDLMPKAEKNLEELMNVHKAKIFLIDHEKKELVNFKDDKSLGPDVFPLKTGIIGKAVEENQVLTVPNAYNHPLFNGKIDIETSMPLICYPIKHPNEQRSIAAIEVINLRGIQGLASLSKVQINSQDLETLEFFSMQLGQILDNIKKYF